MSITDRVLDVVRDMPDGDGLTTDDVCSLVNSDGGRPLGRRQVYDGLSRLLDAGRVARGERGTPDGGLWMEALTTPGTAGAAVATPIYQSALERTAAALVFVQEGDGLTTDSVERIVNEDGQGPALTREQVSQALRHNSAEGVCYHLPGSRPSLWALVDQTARQDEERRCREADLRVSAVLGSRPQTPREIQRAAFLHVAIVRSSLARLVRQGMADQAPGGTYTQRRRAA